ncbi:MAG: hypothetical protein Q8O76_04675 [Chloroflexota bacterium]|nr:hypothetical protein [Chloroflexota bacterium]
MTQGAGNRMPAAEIPTRTLLDAGHLPGVERPQKEFSGWLVKRT